MLKKILLGFAVIIIGFVIVAALQPADYRVERSTTISAPPAVVFAHVNDLNQWQKFSPWAKLDPAAKYTFEGPRAGNGAALAWAGNKEVGAGRMTIVESQPAELVRFRLDFLEPFASTADTAFVFKPAGTQTVVTWSMSGRKNFVSKAVCLFMNMDKMLGGQFEEGLASLKSLSEASTQPAGRT